jgi:hypothetical protein
VRLRCSLWLSLRRAVCSSSGEVQQGGPGKRRVVFRSGQVNARAGEVAVQAHLAAVDQRRYDRHNFFITLRVFADYLPQVE